MRVEVENDKNDRLIMQIENYFSQLLFHNCSRKHEIEQISK